MKKLLFGVLVSLFSVTSYAATTDCVHYVTRDEVKAEMIEFRKTHYENFDGMWLPKEPPKSTKTRAEVKAELVEFRKTHYENFDGIWLPKEPPKSTKTRAEVKAEYQEWIKDHVVGFDGLWVKKPSKPNYCPIK